MNDLVRRKRERKRPVKKVPRDASWISLSIGLLDVIEMMVDKFLWQPIANKRRNWRSSPSKMLVDESEKLEKEWEII